MKRIPINLVTLIWLIAFFFFSFLRMKQKEAPCFWEVSGLVTKKISIFCLWQVALYAKFSKFYKGIFLHLIPVWL